MNRPYVRRWTACSDFSDVDCLHLCDTIREALLHGVTEIAEDGRPFEEFPDTITLTLWHNYAHKPDFKLETGLLRTFFQLVKDALDDKGMGEVEYPDLAHQLPQDVIDTLNPYLVKAYKDWANHNKVDVNGYDGRWTEPELELKLLYEPPLEDLIAAYEVSAETGDDLAENLTVWITPECEAMLEAAEELEKQFTEVPLHEGDL